MLPPELLDAFMSGHFGYGNLAAPIWFIGMEEGGGHSADEVDRRLQAWDALGCRPTSDLREFHERAAIAGRWREPFPISPTWGKLIRVRLASRGIEATRDTIRAYQCDHLGRRDGDTCLLELMPLPSQSVGRWIYGEISADPTLATRDVYMARWLAARVARLRTLIREHRPRSVVFYGASYLAHWGEVAGVELAEAEAGIRTGQGPNTQFVVARHPSARGAGSAHFERVGAMVRGG
jgi:hypothetical protein